jgi:hypothetical protein
MAGAVISFQEMGPGQSTSVLSPTRQSCDRCHKQKLRCKRPDDGDKDSCERCLRKGAQCTYSSSLPKGRPSTYRLGNGSPGPGYSNIEWAVSPTQRVGVLPAQPIPCTTHAADLLSEYAPVAGMKGGSPDFWAQFMRGEEGDTTMAGIISDIDMNLDSAPPQHSSDDQQKGSWQPDQQCTAKFVDNQDAIFQQQCEKPTESRVMHDPTNRPQEQIQLNQSIVLLSQLSARLSSLLSSSRDYPSTMNVPALGIDSTALEQLQSNIGAVFESINVWLARGPSHLQALKAGQNISDQSQLMSHILSASFEMTQIIQRIRNITTPESTPPPDWSGQDVNCNGNAALDILSQSQHPYSTVRHLIVVCVTLLLNTYIGIVISLQHGADALKTHQWATSQTQRRHSTDSAVCTWDTTDRIKLQFVGVVQMCSSFMRRQSEVPEMLMPSTLSSEQLDEDPCWSAVYKLKAELEQRLRQLQVCLDMVD